MAPFGFGLGLYAAIYMFGDVSGGHFNPAVTFGAFLDTRTNLTDLVGYWIGQVVGALLASLAVLWASDQVSVAGTYTTPHVGAGSVFLLEAVLSAIFVMVILQSTKKWPREAPIAISLTLMAIHFAAVPLTGASVNPARTLGPASLVGQPLICGSIPLPRWSVRASPGCCTAYSTPKKPQPLIQTSDPDRTRPATQPVGNFRCRPPSTTRRIQSRLSLTDKVNAPLERGWGFWVGRVFDHGRQL